MRRWFWIGLWLIPFGIIVSIATYALAVAAFGVASVAASRSRLMVGLIVIALVLVFVVNIIGSGWAADEAVKRVKR